MINPLFRIEWRLIPPLEDGIKPWYYISNTGLIYSINSNKFMKLPIVNGYHSISLRTETGAVNKRVHRLLMITFNPIDNYQEYEVNHIDGVKTNNCIWNLEWVTHNENMQHAVRTGLFFARDDRENAKLSDEQVRLICEKIVEGKPPKQISEEMNLENCNIDKIVMNIINGFSWRHISKDYDFSNSFKREFLFTENQIHLICKYFESHGKDATSKEILEYLGIVPETYEDHRRYIVSLSPIRNKKNYKNICNLYNY